MNKEKKDKLNKDIEKLTKKEKLTKEEKLDLKAMKKELDRRLYAGPVVK